MTKQRNSEAYKIFRRIAISNKKNCDELNELVELKHLASKARSTREDLNSVSPMRTQEDDMIGGTQSTVEFEEKVIKWRKKMRKHS